MSMPDRVGGSKVYMLTREPSSLETVTLADFLGPPPSLDAHFMWVLLVQLVVWHGMYSFIDLAVGVESIIPKFVPITDEDQPAVVTPFVGLMNETTGALKVNALTVVPTNQVIVIFTAPLSCRSASSMYSLAVPKPICAWQSAVVIDVHAVERQIVPPIEIVGEWLIAAKLSPLMVTLSKPQVGTFQSSCCDTTGASNENCSHAVPTIVAIVISTC